MFSSAFAARLLAVCVLGGLSLGCGGGNFNAQLPAPDEQSAADFLACIKDPNNGVETVTLDLKGGRNVNTLGTIGIDSKAIKASPVSFAELKRGLTVQMRGAAGHCAAEFALLDSLGDAKSIDAIDKSIDEARKLITVHPVAVKLNGILDQTADHKNYAAVALSTQEVVEFARAVQASHLTNAWEWLAFAHDVRGRCMPEAKSGQASEDLKAKVVAKFIAGYLKAYFRNGELGAVAIKAEDILDKFPGLAEKLGTDGVKKLRDLIASNQKKLVFGKNGDGKFVSRSGDELAFPAVNVTVSPFSSKKIAISDIDFNAVAGQIVRVTFEAIFDALFRVPAVDEATGTAIFAHDDAENAKFNLIKYSQIGRYAKQRQVTVKELGDVHSTVNSIEAVVISTTGQLVRGASWFSLNNEALAKVIESSAGTISRKIAEKAGWCLAYAVGPGRDLTPGGPTRIKSFDIDPAAGGRPRPDRFRVMEFEIRR